MKIMSFNTQHCLNYTEKKIDFEIMARAILKCGADIVGLNEIYGKGSNEDFTAQTETLSRLTGMEHYYFAPAISIAGFGPYGNAFLSKIPILKAETIIIPDPEPKKYKGYYETRCLLKAELEGGITVIVTHLGLNKDEQENGIKSVLKHIRSEKCILMGDFNMEPDDIILNPLRERMTDTACRFSNQLLSFPSDKPEIKIDYIFVSKDIEVKEADIAPIIASDHRPHTATVYAN